MTGPEAIWRSLPARLVGLSLFVLAGYALLWLGARLARLAPAARPGVLRVTPILLQMTPALIACGLAALAMRFFGPETWRRPLALWLVVLCWAFAVVNVFATATYRLELRGDELKLVEPPIPTRRVRAGEISGWRIDERGQLVLELGAKRRMTLSPIAWQGLQQVEAWLERHGVKPAGLNG